MSVKTKTPENPESCMVACPSCGYVNMIKGIHQEGVDYHKLCDNCDNVYGYRFELSVTTFKLDVI